MSLSTISVYTDKSIHDFMLNFSSFQSVQYVESPNTNLSNLLTVQLRCWPSRVYRLMIYNNNTQHGKSALHTFGRSRSYGSQTLNHRKRIQSWRAHLITARVKCKGAKKRAQVRDGVTSLVRTPVWRIKARALVRGGRTNPTGITTQDPWKHMVLQSAMVMHQ